jgi:hypothetical protein
MPEIAVPCDTVPQAAVPVPRKTPVPEGWKLAECLVALCREEDVAVSTTVSMIWTSVTRWMGWTIIVVCMSMTTGEATTKQTGLIGSAPLCFQKKRAFTLGISRQYQSLLSP